MTSAIDSGRPDVVADYAISRLPCIFAYAPGEAVLKRAAAEVNLPLV
jgi:hypothetical protein